MLLNWTQDKETGPAVEQVLSSTIKDFWKYFQQTDPIGLEKKNS